MVGTVVADDLDAGQSISYEIISGNDDEFFEINSSTGEITVLDANGLDYEATTSHVLVVEVTDNASSPLKANAEITILVTDQNEAPIISDFNFTLAENSEEETSVGTITASDEDNGQILSYSVIGGNDDEFFELDPSSGQIIVLDANGLDYETTESFELVVKATDNGTPVLSQTCTVTINLTDQNELPSFVAQEFYADENSEEETIIAELVASDVDAGQTLTFSIMDGNDDEFFDIDGSSGEIYVIDPNGLDYETTSLFILTVKVSDNGTPVLSKTAAITINLNDVNEAPSAQPLSVNIDENTALSTPVGSIVAADTDENSTLTYSIVDFQNNNMFSINSSTGEISVNISELDYETTPVIEFYVEISDGELSTQSKVIVNLNNLNDNSPSLDITTFTIDGPIEVGEAIGTLNIIDADGNISKITIEVISGNELGIFAIDSVTGEIIVAKPELIDFQSSDTITIGLKITDGENEIITDFDISISAITGIEGGRELTNIIRAYPIPATDVIYVSSGHENITKVNILNVNGQIIRSVITNDENKLVEINIDDLRQGVYFIKVMTIEGGIEIIRIIKQ